MIVHVYLGLGTNLGEREANLHAAAAALSPAVHILRASTIIETEPWGYKEQPRFLNQVLEAETSLSPHQLLAYVKALEARLGRAPSFRYGPRLIDIDILFYGEETIHLNDLIIPHPRLAEREFVLRPLCEIAPDLRHPQTGKSMKELLNALESAKGNTP